MKVTVPGISVTSQVTVVTKHPSEPTVGVVIVGVTSVASSPGTSSISLTVQVAQAESVGNFFEKHDTYAKFLEPLFHLLLHSQSSYSFPHLLSTRKK